MKPEDKQKLSSFLHPNKTSKDDVKKAESDSKTFNPHLAVCHSENPPANNRTQPIILKTKDVTKSVSYGYTDAEVKKAFTSFLQDSEMVDVLFNQFVSDAESYNDIITILNNGGYLKS